MQPSIANKKSSFGLKYVSAFALPSTIAFIMALVAGLVWSPVASGQPATGSAQAQALEQTQQTQQTKPAPQEGEWRVIAPTDAMASFRMPKKPRYVERTFTPVENKPPIKVHLYMGTVKDGKATYVFGYHDLHEAPADNRTLNKALEGAVRGSVLNVQGELLSEVTKIRFKTSPGRQFNYGFYQGEKPYIVLSRIFIVGKRQFQVSAISLKSNYDERLAAEFLNSFKLVTVENDEPPVPRTSKK